MGASSKYFSGSAAEGCASTADRRAPDDRIIICLLMSNPAGRGQLGIGCRRRPGRVAAGRQALVAAACSLARNEPSSAMVLISGAAENGGVNVHHMPSASLAVKTISG